MRLYRIETGKVKVKKNQITKNDNILPKYGNILFDNKWSEWLPIYSWIIEHPEGIILVDTGETYRTANKNYLPKWHPYYSFAVKFKVRMQDEIGHQLSQLGINQFKDISKVIMTHLHTDHAGGLHHFPASEILVHKREFVNASGIKGMFAGYLPHRWPSWFNPTFIEFGGSKYGPFPNSFSVTSDRKVIIVSTPGHTYGHISVIVEMDGYHYFLAGDASYTQVNMLDLKPDGIGNENQSVETLQRIKLFCAFNPTIFLPSHDPDVPHRMDNKILASEKIHHASIIID
jgi:N-acyl homoserine lactone hydrolase